MAAIMLVSLFGCLIYVLLNPDPSHSYSMVPPFVLLLLIMVAFFIPYYRDHAGVTYEVNDTAVILWRKGNIWKEIRFDEISTVRNDRAKQSIILIRKAFWRSPIYLHPKSNQDELFEAINTNAKQAGPGYPPQGDGSTDP